MRRRTSFRNERLTQLLCLRSMHAVLGDIDTRHRYGLPLVTQAIRALLKTREEQRRRTTHEP